MKFQQLIQAGGETLWSDIHKFINSISDEGEFARSVEGVY
jgi:hypothetical protein